MTRTVRAAALSATLVAALAGAARAQETGASFGGGDWDEPAGSEPDHAADWSAGTHSGAGSHSGAAPVRTAPLFPPQPPRDPFAEPERARSHDGGSGPSRGPTTVGERRRNIAVCAACGLAPIFAFIAVAAVTRRARRRRFENEPTFASTPMSPRSRDCARCGAPCPAKAERCPRCGAPAGAQPSSR